MNQATHPYSIRQAKAEDAERVQFVVSTVYGEYGWPWEPDAYHQDLMAFEESYLHPGADFFVAEVEGEVVGVGGLVTFPTVPGQRGSLIQYEGYVRIAGTDCEVVRLYLLASQRGRGIGRTLNHAIIQAGVQRRCQALEIWSDKRLHEAHNLYRSCGAILVGDRLCDDAEQSPEWGFILDLSQGMPPRPSKAAE